MKKIVLLIIFLSALTVRSQYVSGNSDDSKRIYLSLRAGYRVTEIKTYDNSNPNGLIFDIKAMAHIGNDYYAGIIFDY